MREKPLTLCKYFAEAMNYKHIFPILLAGCILAGCQQGRYATFSGFAQGGTYTVKADLRSVSVPAEQIQQRIDAILDSIDFSLSGYNKNSLLSRYNAGEEIVPDRFFREVRELSVRYREQTGGAFDVAAGPLFDIWGFGFTSDSLPDPERVRAALAACKEEKVLNFNAIAQGYTCDVVANYLHEIGVHNMLVDIGEIYCEGVNAAGQGWSIGVDNPVDGNDTPGRDLRGIWQSDGRLRYRHLRQLPEILHQGRKKIRPHDRPAHRLSGRAQPAQRHRRGTDRRRSGRPGDRLHGDRTEAGPRPDRIPPRPGGLPDHRRGDLDVGRLRRAGARDGVSAKMINFVVY